LHGLTGFPVAVAFDSAGLAPAAQALRAKHPDLQIFLAADNDHHLPRRSQPLSNVGLEKAQAAAVLVGGRVLAPPFRPEDSGSDWNDFAKQHGPDATRAAIARGLAALAPKLEKTVMSEVRQSRFSTPRSIRRRRSDSIDRSRFDRQQPTWLSGMPARSVESARRLKLGASTTPAKSPPPPLYARSSVNLRRRSPLVTVWPPLPPPR
jgi:phage/plasmid primase-like uncharacterized protein